MVDKDYYRDILQMDYFSEDYLRFEKDFYRFSALKIPLTFLVDDILRMMAASQIPYFVLNSENAVDQQNHYFYFDVTVDKVNPHIRVFKYVKHSYRLF